MNMRGRGKSVTEKNNSFPQSDLALQQLAVAGDAGAEEALVQRYSKLVKACARPYFLAGSNSEDLIQEGMMGLLSAVRAYDPARDSSFYAYAELCIRRRLFSAIRSANRRKHTPLNDSVSLESQLFDEDQNPLACSFYRAFSRDPEDEVIAKEQEAELFKAFSQNLSALEAEILGLYLEGLSYSEIAAKVNKSPKSVDNAVQRMRRKLAQRIEQGDISKN